MIGERKLVRIGLAEFNVSEPALPGALLGELQRFRGNINPDHPATTVHQAGQRDRRLTRAARNIQHVHPRFDLHFFDDRLGHATSHGRRLFAPALRRVRARETIPIRLRVRGHEPIITRSAHSSPGLQLPRPTHQRLNQLAYEFFRFFIGEVSVLIEAAGGICDPHFRLVTQKKTAVGNQRVGGPNQLPR